MRTGPLALPLYVLGEPDISAARVRAVARRLNRHLTNAKREPAKLIAIDYLQLMRPENPRDNRTQQIGLLALRMKHMARELGVPVLLLSQLNRESEHGNRRPPLSDLRESGDVEQHADRVFLLHREKNQNADAAVWPVDLIIAKNRNGPVGDIRLDYRRPVLRFEAASIPD